MIAARVTSIDAPLPGGSPVRINTQQTRSLVFLLLTLPQHRIRVVRERGRYVT